jgi:hypothetical protein
MRFWVLTGLLAVSAGCSNPPQVPEEHDNVPASPFAGAWIITETTKVTPDSTWTNPSPPTGLYIFTGSHFSNMLIDGSGPRSLFPPRATPEQRLAAYDPFIADAGTYEFNDSLLITNNIIAKVPNVMNAQVVYRYRISGDSLTLTFSGAWAPSDGEITYRLVRLPPRTGSR